MPIKKHPHLSTYELLPLGEPEKEVKQSHLEKPKKKTKAGNQRLPSVFIYHSNI